MSTQSTTARLLTVADLNSRWGLEDGSGIVMEHVHAGLLRFVDLSPRGVKRSTPGQKTIRFRLSDVEAFETDRTRAWERPKAETVPDPVVSLPGAALPGWDGKVRGRGKGKAARQKAPGR